MKVLHISAECYPAAKTGGLGDVVGALPHYLTKNNFPAAAIIPKYGTNWLQNASYEIVFEGIVQMHIWRIPFTIQKIISVDLNIELYVTDIPGKFDRPGIYANPNGHFYGDEIERWVCFQQAVLLWIIYSDIHPEILHCHDHHTGLVPFMVKYCPWFETLKNVPTYFTIHNGRYQGMYSWDKMYLLPPFLAEARSLLDWNHAIHFMACGIKCCWQFGTVSFSYLNELMSNSDGLESLIRGESFKSMGIVNGIDSELWNPATDTFVPYHLKKSIPHYKRNNKKYLAEKFNLNPKWPIITFIGRMVYEKGVDILPDAIQAFLGHHNDIHFIILGSGDTYYENRFRNLSYHFDYQVKSIIGYDERLSHELYAGSDFLIMPSHIEPCGLNQLYALRYGTIPIIRRTGGLQDTIIDIGDENGVGICFNHTSVPDITHALSRAVRLVNNVNLKNEIIKRGMLRDHSWEEVSKQYIQWYKK